MWNLAMINFEKRNVNNLKIVINSGEIPKIMGMKVDSCGKISCFHIVFHTYPHVIPIMWITSEYHVEIRLIQCGNTKYP